MFGNSRYGWKLAGALGLVALLGAYARSRGRQVDPPLWQCLAEPERWEGAGLLLERARIVSVDGAGFRVEAEGSSVQVRGLAPGRPGDRGRLEAVFDSRGPSLRLVRWQPARRPSPAGTLLLGLEVATIAGVLLNFWRHFSFRPKALQAEATK